jgi:hypothetical protein
MPQLRVRSVESDLISDCCGPVKPAIRVSDRFQMADCLAVASTKNCIETVCGGCSPHTEPCSTLGKQNGQPKRERGSVVEFIEDHLWQLLLYAHILLRRHVVRIALDPCIKLAEIRRQDSTGYLSLGRKLNGRTGLSLTKMVVDETRRALTNQRRNQPHFS